MNRRDFIKVTLFGLAGLFLPEFTTERIGEKMALGDLLEKLATQKQLSREEVQELRLVGNQLSFVSSFVQGIQSPEGMILDGKINFPINKIYSTVLESDTASLNIEIPSIYTHLIIMAAGRSTTGGTGNAVLKATYNSDTGSNYETEIIYGIAAVVGAQVSTIVDAAIIGGLAKDGEAAGVSGSGIVFIPNIRSALHKATLSILSPASSTDIFVQSCDWKSTQSLRSIQVFADTGNIKAGSAISIYGLV